MDLIEIIVLGLVQGLTEFLPVSSTAHLRIVPAFFGWDDPGAAFTAITQLGTMAAVVWYFRVELWAIGRSWTRATVVERRRPEVLSERLGWYIIVGTLPLIFFGALFTDQVETAARDLYLIAATLIALGLVLLLAELVGRRDRDIDTLTWRDALIVGFAQALALVPGVSRAGATITAGLFIGLNRPAAARYSFLLSVPAVVASGLYELWAVVRGTTAIETDLAATLLATAIAFVAAYLTIDWLLRFLARHSTGIFVAYRVVLGAAIFLLLGIGAIS